MANYSKEQRDMGVDLYIKYERCAADVIRELGYPSKGVLLSWYADRLEEERTGVPSERGERYRRYSDEQTHTCGVGARLTGAVLTDTASLSGRPASHRSISTWRRPASPASSVLWHDWL